MLYVLVKIIEPILKIQARLKELKLKRYGNLYERICDMDNLKLAHINARKGKSHYKEVRWVNNNEELALLQIQQTLLSKTYQTSEYTVEDIVDKGKNRTIHKLPYYPDRIVHHAVMQLISPIMNKYFIRDSFQSIPNRGCFDAKKKIESFIRSIPTLESNEYYFVKIDIKKFYPSVNNGIMKEKLRNKIKCKDSLYLLDEIIDSNVGLPIGNFTSQYLGNFYLTSMDFYFKHTLKIKGYWRYCDDILVLCKKEQISYVLDGFKSQINSLRLTLKNNPSINTLSHGVDFCGYIFNHNHTTMRRKIKYNFVSSCKAQKITSVASYYGWCKHTNSYNLWTKSLENLRDKNWRNQSRSNT